MRVLSSTDSFCNELKWLPYTPLLPNDFIILTVLEVPYMMGRIGPKDVVDDL
jgi:hypothetical protein